MLRFPEQFHTATDKDPVFTRIQSTMNKIHNLNLKLNRNCKSVKLIKIRHEFDKI